MDTYSAGSDHKTKEPGSRATAQAAKKKTSVGCKYATNKARKRGEKAMTTTSRPRKVVNNRWTKKAAGVHSPWEAGTVREGQAGSGDRLSGKQSRQPSAT